MKDVKRYSEHDGEGGGVCPAKDGRFVTFLDYDLLGRKSQSKIDLLSNKLAAETLRADTAEATVAERDEALALKQRDLIEAQTAVAGWARKHAAAEQRVSELKELLQDLFNQCELTLYFDRRIEAALNPKPEAGSHEN